MYDGSTNVLVLVAFWLRSMAKGCMSWKGMVYSPKKRDVGYIPQAAAAAAAAPAAAPAVIKQKMEMWIFLASHCLLTVNKQRHNEMPHVGIIIRMQNQ